MYCTDDTYMLAPVIAEHLPAGINACLRLVACEYWRAWDGERYTVVRVTIKNSDAHRVDVGIGCARLWLALGCQDFCFGTAWCDSAQCV